MSQIEIGRVIKPHGLRGEVGVLLHRPDSDLLERVATVTLVDKKGTVVVARLEGVARMGRGFRVKFGGFDDIHAAEQLRGATLQLPREELPALDTGESYLTDLVGARVIGPEGDEFGVVVGVQCYPSVDSVVIDKLDGSRVEQPLVEDWVTILDPKVGAIALKSLEGLL